MAVHRIHFLAKEHIERKVGRAFVSETMKRKLPCAVIIVLLLGAAGCSTVERSQSSLQEWRRSYLPARQA
jgi:hypothetical protein